MPQFSYVHPVAVNGQIAEDGPVLIDSYLNAYVAQESDVDLGGNDNGTYTVQIDGEEGTFDGMFVKAGAETTSDIIDALITNFGDELLNIAELTNNDPALEVRFIHPNREYTFSFPSNPAGNLSHDLVQAAGGTRIPLATVVVQGTNADEAVAPTGTSTDSNALGLLVRNTDSDVNSGDPTVDDGFPPGSMLSVLKQGPAWANVEEAVSVNGDVYVRRANAAAGQNLGGLRGSGDGTARVETITPTAVNDQQYALRIDVDADGNGDWKSYTIAALGDGTATATEICDDYRTQLAAITALTGVVTGSGTATLILTGAAGVRFAATDLGPGVSAVVETTAGSFDTFKLRNAKFKTATTGVGLAKVQLNRPYA